MLREFCCDVFIWRTVCKRFIYRETEVCSNVRTIGLCDLQAPPPLSDGLVTCYISFGTARTGVAERTGTRVTVELSNTSRSDSTARVRFAEIDLRPTLSVCIPGGTDAHVPSAVTLALSPVQTWRRIIAGIDNCNAIKSIHHYSAILN